MDQDFLLFAMVSFGLGFLFLLVVAAASVHLSSPMSATPLRPAEAPLVPESQPIQINQIVAAKDHNSVS